MAGGMVPVPGLSSSVDLGVGDTAVGQFGFAVGDLDGTWLPNPPPPFGPRKADVVGGLVFPKASVLPPEGDVVSGEIALEVTWVPASEEEVAAARDDRTDAALRKYLAYAKKERGKDADDKVPYSQPTRTPCTTSGL